MSTASEPPPEPLVFFVDRCLGLGVVQAFREAGHEALWHDDHFAQDASDEAWLPIVGGNDWVVLHSDKNIRRSPVGREIVRRFRMRVFVFASGNQLPMRVKIAIILRHLAKVEGLARTQPPPFVAGITKSGVHLYDLAATRQRPRKKRHP